jgi:outer membrane lipoprotein-sorting protein
VRPIVTEFVEWLAGTLDVIAELIAVTKSHAESVTCEKCGVVMATRPTRARLAYERIQ